MSDIRNFNNVLIINNKEVYKELDLDDFSEDIIIIGNADDSQIKINMECDIAFNVKFARKNNGWQISDGENSYCVINGVKVPRRIISNGDKISIKNVETKEELFKINYFIDFTVENEDYDRVISVKDVKKVKIGSGKNNNIIIDDSMVDSNHAEIIRSGNNYSLVDIKSKFGVYLNGKKVEDKITLESDDFIIICGYKFLFSEEKLLMSKENEKIEVKDLKVFDNKNKSPLNYPCFYRSPRLLQNISQEDIIIDEPPTKEKPPKNNLMITMIPLLGTIVLTTSVSRGGDKGSMIQSVGMVGLTAFVTILAYVMQVMDAKKKQFKRYKKYKEYVKDKEKQIIDKRKALMESIRNNNPDTEECITFVESFDRRLWERTPQHEDFLNVSLGRGAGDLTFDIKVQEQKLEIDVDKLKDDPRKLKDIYGKMEDVPICLNFTNDYPIGIYGDRKNTIELVKNILVKISTLHYYDDVKIAAIYPEKEEAYWDWLKWIPHTWTGNKEFRYIGNTKESAHNVLNVLYDEIKGRNQGDSYEKVNYSPYYIIVISDRVLIENEPIMGLLESGDNYGASGVFVYEDLSSIPKESKKIIKVGSENSATFIDVHNSNQAIDITFNPIDGKISEKFSRKMAPVFVKNSFTQGALTSYYTLFDLYDIKSEEELPITKNWNTSKVYETMAVPLGVRVGDEIVYLNLHEKFHGPHGLVAGTTGSGKSEIMQTYIASLAINYHPHDVSFIIIDYKGGGMANQFKDLPHLVGTITNLDGNQINRSLISIKSELKRRQRIFAEYDVNHIDAYIKLYKKGEAKEPIPHLIMIADEFAELKNDQPEFMTELVSAARIGRSLGVHLILATQKPSGVVDDQIWSNSKFKLCLKVQTAEDSNEMIKSPLAANIVEAGRAYFQVGNNEIFELFQSAWSGAKKYEEDDISKKEIEISEVLIDGRRKTIFSSKDDKAKKEGKTQLDAVISRVSTVAEENGINRLQGPWLPSLEEIIYLDDLIGKFDYSSWNKDDICVKPVIGVLDNPEKQVQYRLSINLSETGHTMIVGSPGVGKTTLLQTLVTSLITSYSPELVNIYIMDFGSRILKMYEKAPQVGGVITTDDEVLTKNFINFIKKEILRRKDLFSSSGVSNILSYHEATGNILPQIVIVVDNFAAFIELYEDYEDDMTKFSRDGANLGISLVVTASNSGDVRYKISSNFKNNIVLNCVDTSEYSGILGRIEIEPAKNQGRGLIKDGQVCEFQTALPLKGANEGERANKTRDLIEEINRNWNKKRATSIPMVSKDLSIKKFIDNMPDTNGLNTSFFGIDLDEIEYVDVNFSEIHVLPIVGKPSSGKSNLLKVFANYFYHSCKESNYDIYIYDSESYGMADIEESIEATFYGNNSSDIIENLRELKEEFDIRREFLNEKLYESRGRVKEVDLLKSYSKKIIVIDNISELLNRLEDEYELIEMIGEIIEKKHGYGFVIILSGQENELVDLSYNHGFMDAVRKANQGILLQDIEEQDYFNVRVNYSSNKKMVKEGEGYLITRLGYKKIQIPYVN